MIFFILLLIKIMLFMNITKVENNQILIFMTSTLITLFIFGLIHFSKTKKKNIIGLSVYFVISILMFIDVMHYSYFNTLPSVSALNLVGQVGAVGESVRELFTLKNALFLIDLPFLIVYTIKSTKIDPKTYNKCIRWGILGGAFALLVIFLSILSAKDLLAPVSSQEFFTYHIKDIKQNTISSEVAEGSSMLTQEDLDQLKERNKLIEGEYTGIGKNKNLIVIQVEALQNFVINLEYEGQEVTPNLNKLINEKGSLYFNNYHQHIGRGNTSDAEFVTNNSLYPSDEESIYQEYANNKFYGLPWILRNNGYSAWVFHGYKKEFWNREKAYVNIGFERFVSEEDYKFTEDETSGFGIIDEVFFDQTMDYMKELDNVNDNPFYAFMITLTSHTPFEIPEKLQYLDLKEEHKGTMLGNYLQAIHYADKALGQFLESLKKEGYYDNSVIAIYGDHFAMKAVKDEEINLMTDFLKRPYNMDDVMNVPLIIHIPGIEDTKTITKLGSQLDFLPTILNIMGYENDKGIMFGRDLINYEGDTYVAPLAYAVKGSFIDDDVIFYMSRDGIFKNSTAVDRETGKEIEDISGLRDTYEMAIDEINKSNYILKKDILRYLIDNNGHIDLKALEALNIPKEKKIPKCYENVVKELKKSIFMGKKVLSVDVKWSDNKENVLLSDGTDVYELAKFMVEHKDVYAILRTSEKDESVFLKIKDLYPHLRDRFIVEMTDFEDHANLTMRAYKNIMLNLTENQYTEEEVIEFLNRSPLLGVILNKDSANESFVKTLKNMNALVYIDNNDCLKLLK